MITNDGFKKIIDTFYTPSYVFDEDELVERAGAIRQMLDGISFCYSIKANPFLIPALMPVVDYFEVCSPGELAICKELSVPAEKIIYSGVNKGSEDIKVAIEYRAAILTAESVRQYELICETTRELGTETDVILRLSAKNQFGMSLVDIEKILSKPVPFVNIKGIHFFAGTGHKQIEKRRDELLMLTDTLSSLRDKYNMELPMLEYGPGLNFPYFTGDDFSDTLLPLKELMPGLKEAAKKCSLSIEMGRFIASSCGYYLTSICDIKNSDETNWCIVDGGINHVNYLGQMMGLKAPVIMHYRDGKVINDGGGEIYTVCGSLCTVNDVLVRKMPIKNPKVGDVLVFRNTGAYSVTEAMGLFLSRTLPRIIAYKDDETRLVRDYRESWKMNIQDDK